ncbi:hypothetical protein JXA47_03355 [Candidatus Sumerlaeota bacterium]|nr:hypothetical protein [Candidatus Sumerlaeota bacterium]
MRHLFPTLGTSLLLGMVLSVQGGVTTVEIHDDVLRPEPRRLGINVGGRSQWGAAQILKNLIDNPGFEAGLYGTVFHVAEGATGTRIPIDFWDTSWNNDTHGVGMPEGFWNGAEWEIVYGPAAGRSGTVSNFTHEDNRYVLTLDSDGTAPEKWDVILVRREIDGPADADPTQARPGSPGEQSLHLLPGDEPWQSAYHFYMDSVWRDGDRTAGKMLIIEGDWHVGLWARGNREGAQLRIRFRREGEADFFDETVLLTTEWQLIERDAVIAPGTDRLGPYTDEEYHPILDFSLGVPVQGDEVWVDDVELLRSSDTNPTVFTDTCVDRLRELQPGVLRNWKTSDFGSSLENMIAEPWARRTTGWRPHERRATGWGYSMHEFFELCREVGAEPWQIIPPTMSPEDLGNLAEYLSAPADGSHPWAERRAALGQVEPWTDVFETIHIEFGNELWGGASGGDPFWGASLLGGTRLGHIAHDRFALIQASPHFDSSQIDLIIGGQAGYPGRQQEIEAASSNHDTVALAPYFGVLDTWSSDDEIFLPLFARPLDDVTHGRVRQSQDFLDAAGQSTRMAIYEINFHTTHGDSPIDVRNDFVTGQGGAIALPLHMLTLMRDLGVDLQCAFSSLQYAFRLESGEYVHLWGMLRDLEGTGRKRPTWLGVELVNRAIVGDLVTTVQGGTNPQWSQTAINGVSEVIDIPVIQSFAFRHGPRHSVILFNLSLTETQTVQLDLPSESLAEAELHRIAPPSVHDDNESDLAVEIEASAISDFADGHLLDLPPHSVSVILWSEVSTPGLTLH